MRKVLPLLTAVFALLLPAVASAAAAPPETWQEHWEEHNQLLHRVDYNDTVALYFDNDVNPAAKDWIMPYVTKMWKYVRDTYGTDGNRVREDRLYSIHHQGRYFGGHPSTVYDSSHDNRNVSDVGLDDWANPEYGIVTHETAHVIESIASGKNGSPAFGLWRDSKWAEFYIYDVYSALGMQDQAKAEYDHFLTQTDDFPRAGTHWFRDWFYPLWRDHGHAQVMVKFFDLIGKYFPANGNDYARSMNWGEFVHFMSGAAGTDLKQQATTAFGWPNEWESQFRQARREFPAITY